MRSLPSRLFALCALMLLAPLLIVVTVLVRSRLGSPVLFSQIRPGLRGKLFRMHKFRTMTDDRDADGRLQPDEQRITTFGRFLRSTSLDELPELWNVVRGEMRIIGPRPLLPEYIPLYTNRQARRHDVHPGLTGWAQINGRNAISWNEKLELDVWYVENSSWCLDCRILLRTVALVVRRDGISSEGAATMTRFTGTREMSE